MVENAQISCPIQWREAFYLYRKWLESSTNALAKTQKEKLKLPFDYGCYGSKCYFNITLQTTRFAN
jgi:hypothetical protein